MMQMELLKVLYIQSGKNIYTLVKLQTSQGGLNHIETIQIIITTQPAKSYITACGNMDGNISLKLLLREIFSKKK